MSRVGLCQGLQLLNDLGTAQAEKEMEVLKRKYQKNMALVSRQSRVKASIFKDNQSRHFCWSQISVTDESDAQSAFKRWKYFEKKVQTSHTNLHHFFNRIAMPMPLSLSRN